MRIVRWVLVGGAIAVGSLTCVIPTDRSGDLHVALDSLPTLLVRDSLRLAPRLVDADEDAIPAVIAFTSSDPTVLNVDTTGMVRAVGVGSAILTVRAVGWASAAPFTQSVRVRGKIEVDSVRPTDVRFGDSLEIFGVGLQPDSLFAIELGGIEAQVQAFLPDDPTRPEREGRLRIWVPPPAGKRSALTLLGFAGGLVVPDSIDVEQHDLYEPNDTLPWALGPLPLGLHNPALALEPRSRDATVGANNDRQPADWYTFVNPTAQDRTIVFYAQGAGAQAFGAFITDSLWWSSALQAFRVGPTWTVGLQTYLCGGLPFTRNGEAIKVEETLFPLSIVAIRNLPAGTYHVLIPYSPLGQPSPYELLIANDYVSVLQPDVAEENDYCNVATPLPAGAGTLSLTIDNPHDVDWFTFTAPLLGGFSVRVTAQHPDADLDLYLVRDLRPDSLPVVAIASSAGQSDSLNLPLVLPGKYLLLVVDFPGQPTAYTMTTSVGAAAAGAPGGAAAAGAAVRARAPGEGVRQSSRRTVPPDLDRIRRLLEHHRP
jgi:hypothetical protein